MRFSSAVAALLGGLQAASALKLAPRTMAERDSEVGAVLLSFAFSSSGAVRYRLLHTDQQELELKSRGSSTQYARRALDELYSCREYCR
jgi:hypothetical protein